MGVVIGSASDVYISDSGYGGGYGGGRYGGGGGYGGGGYGGGYGAYDIDKLMMMAVSVG